MLPKTLLSFLFVLVPQTADGWLGVYLRDTDHPEIAEVIPGSPAAKAGLRAGDRFLAVGDVETGTRAAFVRAIRGVAPGTEVALRIRRGGRQMEVEARLAEAPGDAEVPRQAEPEPVREQPPRPGQEPAPARRAFLGLSLRQDPDGVRVHEVVEDGPSDAAGVRAGELLERLGDREVLVLRDVEQALSNRAPGERIALALRSDKGSRSVLVELGAAPGSPPARDREPRQARSLELVEDMAAARRVAEAQGKPILVVFGASWDSASRAQRKALADPSLANLIDGAVPVWLDTDGHGAEAERLQVQELPHLRILRDGKTVWKHEGYLPPAELAGVLAEHAGAGTPAGTGELDPGAVDPEVSAALERAARRLERVEDRLRRLATAARELDGLAELRQELEAIRELLRDLSGQ